MCLYFSSADQMVIQLTYGEEIWKSMGAELAAWNADHDCEMRVDIPKSPFHS
jgi:hypothetical protein